MSETGDASTILKTNTARKRGRPPAFNISKSLKALQEKDLKIFFYFMKRSFIDNIRMITRTELEQIFGQDFFYNLKKLTDLGFLILIPNKSKSIQKGDSRNYYIVNPQFSNKIEKVLLMNMEKSIPFLIRHLSELLESFSLKELSINLHKNDLDVLLFFYNCSEINGIEEIERSTLKSKIVEKIEPNLKRLVGLGFLLENIDNTATSRNKEAKYSYKLNPVLMDKIRRILILSLDKSVPFFVSKSLLSEIGIEGDLNKKLQSFVSRLLSDLKIPFKTKIPLFKNKDERVSIQENLFLTLSLDKLRAENQSLKSEVDEVSVVREGKMYFKLKKMQDKILDLERRLNNQPSIPDLPKNKVVDNKLEKLKDEKKSLFVSNKKLQSDLIDLKEEIKRLNKKTSASINVERKIVNITHEFIEEFISEFGKLDFAEYNSFLKNFLRDRLGEKIDFFL